MYNFSVPSTFKAYIDQIVRVNRTFAVNEQGYQGLVQGKKMLIFTASGGSYRQGTPAAGYDFQEPFSRAIFGLVGITDITFMHADNLSAGDDAVEQSLAEVHTAIQEAVTSW